MKKASRKAKAKRAAKAKPRVKARVAKKTAPKKKVAPKKKPVAKKAAPKAPRKAPAKAKAPAKQQTAASVDAVKQKVLGTSAPTVMQVPVDALKVCIWHLWLVSGGTTFAAAYVVSVGGSVASNWYTPDPTQFQPGREHWIRTTQTGTSALIKVEQHDTPSNCVSTVQGIVSSWGLPSASAPVHPSWASGGASGADVWIVSSVTFSPSTPSGVVNTVNRFALFMPSSGAPTWYRISGLGTDNVIGVTTSYAYGAGTNAAFTKINSSNPSYPGSGWEHTTS